jgi:hypothetical protein
MRLLAVVLVLLTAVYGIGASSALAVSPDDTQEEQNWDVPEEPMDEPMEEPMDEPMEAPDYDAPYPGSFDDEDEINSDPPEYPDDPPPEDDIRY